MENCSVSASGSELSCPLAAKEPTLQVFIFSGSITALRGTLQKRRLVDGSIETCMTRGLYRRRDFYINGKPTKEMEFKGEMGKHAHPLVRRATNQRFSMQQIFCHV